MEVKIQKQIIDYFSFFEEFYNSTRTCLKECTNCVIAVNKLTTRCKKIKGAEIKGTPLEDFNGVQSKLTACLHNLISREIVGMRNNLTKVEDLFDKLCIKNRTLQDSCVSINSEDQSLLVKGTPLQPPLKLLLEFAEDTITFGSEICAQVDISLKVITFKELTAESQFDNLKISTSRQQRISEILAYTSFCADNQL